ncbi:hypothetical protein MASR1M60_13790 [Rhodocyclaceae bacterium]
MLRSLLFLTCCILFSLPATAGQLQDILPLAKDDTAALTQLRATPERHALLYFGDHMN